MIVFVALLCLNFLIGYLQEANCSSDPGDWDFEWKQFEQYKKVISSDIPVGSDVEKQLFSRWYTDIDGGSKFHSRQVETMRLAAQLDAAELMTKYRGVWNRTALIERYKQQEQQQRTLLQSNEHKGREVDCSYRAAFDSLFLPTAESTHNSSHSDMFEIRFAISQSDCLVDNALRGGSSFQVYSRVGLFIPTLIVDKASSADNDGKAESEAFQLAISILLTCKVEDLFNNKYIVYCGFNANSDISAADAQANRNQSHHNSSKPALLLKTLFNHPRAMMCSNTSIEVDYEHFDAFADIRPLRLPLLRSAVPIDIASNIIATASFSRYRDGNDRHFEVRRFEDGNGQFGSLTCFLPAKDVSLGSESNDNASNLRGNRHTSATRAASISNRDPYPYRVNYNWVDFFSSQNRILIDNTQNAISAELQQILSAPDRFNIARENLWQQHKAQQNRATAAGIEQTPIGLDIRYCGNMTSQSANHMHNGGVYEDSKSDMSALNRFLFPRHSTTARWLGIEKDFILPSLFQQQEKEHEVLFLGESHMRYMWDFVVHLYHSPKPANSNKNSNSTGDGTGDGSQKGVDFSSLSQKHDDVALLSEVVLKHRVFLPNMWPVLDEANDYTMFVTPSLATISTTTATSSSSSTTIASSTQQQHPSTHLDRIAAHYAASYEQGHSRKTKTVVVQCGSWDLDTFPLRNLMDSPSRGIDYLMEKLSYLIEIRRSIMKDSNHKNKLPNGKVEMGNLHIVLLDIFPQFPKKHSRSHIGGWRNNFAIAAANQRLLKALQRMISAQAEYVPCEPLPSSSSSSSSSSTTAAAQEQQQEQQQQQGASSSCPTLSSVLTYDLPELYLRISLIRTMELMLPPNDGSAGVCLDHSLCHAVSLPIQLPKQKHQKQPQQAKTGPIYNDKYVLYSSIPQGIAIMKLVLQTVYNKEYNPQLSAQSQPQQQPQIGKQSIILNEKTIFCNILQMEECYILYNGQKLHIPDRETLHILIKNRLETCLKQTQFYLESSVNSANRMQQQSTLLAALQNSVITNCDKQFGLTAIVYVTSEVIDDIVTGSNSNSNRGSYDRQLHALLSLREQLLRVDSLAKAANTAESSALPSPLSSSSSSSSSAAAVLPTALPPSLLSLSLLCVTATSESEMSSSSPITGHWIYYLLFPNGFRYRLFLTTRDKAEILQSYSNLYTSTTTTASNDNNAETASTSTTSSALIPFYCPPEDLFPSPPMLEQGQQSGGGREEGVCSPNPYLSDGSLLIYPRSGARFYIYNKQKEYIDNNQYFGYYQWNKQAFTPVDKPDLDLIPFGPPFQFKERGSNLRNGTILASKAAFELHRSNSITPLQSEITDLDSYYYSYVHNRKRKYLSIEMFNTIDNPIGPFVVSNEYLRDIPIDESSSSASTKGIVTSADIYPIEQCPYMSCALFDGTIVTSGTTSSIATAGFKVITEMGEDEEDLFLIRSGLRYRYFRRSDVKRKRIALVAAPIPSPIDASSSTSRAGVVAGSVVAGSVVVDVDLALSVPVVVLTAAELRHIPLSLQPLYRDGDLLQCQLQTFVLVNKTTMRLRLVDESTLADAKQLWTNRYQIHKYTNDTENAVSVGIPTDCLFLQLLEDINAKRDSVPLSSDTVTNAVSAGSSSLTRSISWEDCKRMFLSTK